MTGDETLRRAEEAELAARRGHQGDEIVSPLADADERVIESALRPKRLTEFTGQARVREQLSLILTSALRRGRPPDHVLLAGPPGLGKTTIAMIIAAELGTPLRITSGPAIERSGDLAAVLSTLGEGEVMFIDEIHRLARPAEEMLYLAMEDFRVDVVVGKGPGATAIPLEIAPFTLVGATTRAGLLPAPLRDRFGFTAHLDFYEAAELEVILRRWAALGALVGGFSGGPVGLSTLAVAVGEEAETVEVVAEPFLVRAGLMARTPRGRVATPAAWAHLGLEPPAPAQAPGGPGDGAAAITLFD